MKNRPLVSAALLGLGGGLRSFAPPVALALRGRGPLAGPARFLTFGLAGRLPVVCDPAVIVAS